MRSLTTSVWPPSVATWSGVESVIRFLQKKIKMAAIGGTKGGVCVPCRQKKRGKLVLMKLRKMHNIFWTLVCPRIPRCVKIQPACGDNILVKFEQFLKNTRGATFCRNVCWCIAILKTKGDHAWYMCIVLPSWEQENIVQSFPHLCPPLIFTANMPPLF